MNTTFKITITALVLATFAGQASAHHNNSRFDYAKVSSVEPIYKTVTHRVPEQQCWTEIVRYDADGYRSNTGTILGGIIGAAVGNNLGHSTRNKQVGAVAGAILGASIGSDISHRNQRNEIVTEYKDVERCETRYVTEHEERLVGYDVTYQYHGQTYLTRTNNHPGKRIKVAVSVRPAY